MRKELAPLALPPPEVEEVTATAAAKLPQENVLVTQFDLASLTGRVLSALTPPHSPTTSSSPLLQRPKSVPVKRTAPARTLPMPVWSGAGAVKRTKTVLGLKGSTYNKLALADLTPYQHSLLASMSLLSNPLTTSTSLTVTPKRRALSSSPGPVRGVLTAPPDERGRMLRNSSACSVAHDIDPNTYLPPTSRKLPKGARIGVHEVRARASCVVGSDVIGG